MKILISNGNPDPGNLAFEAYLSALEKTLTAQGQQVTLLTLRDLDLRGCNGCWGCWVKTPGECVQADDGPRLRQAVLQSDFYLLASPLRMGYLSALTKTSLDKSLPTIHPYFKVAHGEAHHRPRYDHYPRMGLLLQAEPSTGEKDLRIVSEIFSRAALNMQSKLEFSLLASEPVDSVAAAITAPAPKTGVPFRKGLPATVGSPIPPPSRLTIFNGSPRGRKSNTQLLVEQFQRGFEETPGRSVEIFHLNRLHDRELFTAAFASAECVLLGFPLYVDAMPAQVKRFIEDLAPFVGRPDNPPMLFLVQSGFPEAAHSRYVERYLELLAARLGSPYVGTMVRGGVEGIQIQPGKMTAPLFEKMRDLGREFGRTGALDPALQRAFSGLERFPAWTAPLFTLLSHTSLLNGYWDMQLKRNGAFAQRFARPYEQRRA